MKVVVALRTSNASQARQLLAEQDCEIHKSRFETQEPALRNLIDGLYRQGLDAELQGASLSWFLIEANLSPKQWLAQSSVAICFSFDWFEQQTAQIRYLKGIAYCDAAASWAKLLPINDRAASEPQAEGTFDWQGLSGWQTAISSKTDVRAEQTPEVLEVEENFSVDECLLAEGSLPPEADLSAEDSSSTQEKPKKNSARKIITKIFTATKNIAQVRLKTDASTAHETEPVSAVEHKVVTTPVVVPLLELDQPVVKKRGRPRKNPLPESGAPSISESSDARIASAEIKSDGVKPVKVKPAAVADATSVVPKKRGRPRKVVATEISELDEEQLDLFVS